MSDVLSQLQAANPKLGILSVGSPEFEGYGRVLEEYDAGEITAQAKAILPVSDGVVYEASVPDLEKVAGFTRAVSREAFGGVATQVGWCYGSNVRMGALEYHKAIEVLVCLTDVVLLVGDLRDVAFGDRITYDTANVAAFFASEGRVLEFHSWNLHYAPIHVHQGGQFATLVCLPKGTNEPLPYASEKKGESALLFGINKWLIAHPGDKDLAAQGAYAGLLGDEIVVVPA